MSIYYKGERPEMMKFIPRTSKTTLEIGCGEGNFSAYIKKELGTEAWGVELFEDAAKKAELIMDKVIVGDVTDIVRKLPDKKFDCIIFNDVLEHLTYPDELLKILHEKLTENGVIVASIPNMRFFRVLGQLLFKKDWRYTDEGILDRTHLRFFTFKSMRRLFEEANYSVIELEGINKTKSTKPLLLNIFTFNAFSDSYFLQFALVAKSKKSA